MRPRILCVDDEPMVLKGLKRSLRGKFDAEFAEGGEQALAVLAKGAPYAVVLSDMRMPGMDGAELLAQVRRLYPETVRMMLTGNSDQFTAIRAINEGNIFRFLGKPCDPADLQRGLQDALHQHSLICAEREVLEQTVNGCIKVLTEILAISDPSFVQAADELKELAEDVARDLGMEHPWQMPMAVMLARLGRVTLPPELLERSESGVKLEPEEQGVLDQIPALGARLLGNIPRLEGVARIVELQAMDAGSEGGDEAPLGSRILRVLADMLQLESSGCTRSEALARLGPKTHDPRVVEAVASRLGIGVEPELVGTRPVLLKDLRVGDLLASPIETLDGRLILREGHRIGQVVLERIRNYHLTSGLKEPVEVHLQREAQTARKRRAS